MKQDTDYTSITAAARAAGVARSTVQRWISSGRMDKQPGGKVSRRDLERCLEEHCCGRPFGPIGAGITKRLAMLFVQAQGSRLLKAVLRYYTNEMCFKGKGYEAHEILTEVTAELQRDERFLKTYESH